MTEATDALLRFYRGWGRYQQQLRAMLAPLSPDQLALPSAVHHWSIGLVAQHIVANRVWWFHGWMGVGSAALAPMMAWDPGDHPTPPVQDAAALVAELEATWQMIAAALGCWTAADLDVAFAPPAFLSAAEQRAFGTTTREWMIWHVLEHEIHHGGELSVALGTHGLPGIYGTVRGGTRHWLFERAGRRSVRGGAVLARNAQP